MITYKEISEIKEIIESIKCDKCGAVSKDEWEIQEYYHFNFYAGYGAKYFIDNDFSKGGRL